MCHVVFFYSSGQVHPLLPNLYATLSIENKKLSKFLNSVTMTHVHMLRTVLAWSAIETLEFEVNYRTSLNGLQLTHMCIAVMLSSVDISTEHIPCILTVLLNSSTTSWKRRERGLISTIPTGLRNSQVFSFTESLTFIMSNKRLSVGSVTIHRLVKYSPACGVFHITLREYL